ncbi:hypothetical protein KC19_3G159100 [Ceratodon purpureus]|uniref:Uncharacterized protein n=1 Tax=Ceratodon purpureus TaxID=3225 RepID=A0A8T0IMQ5_CERPU|nr:hypothetical protein KC19_3G159100 [Ceratodon purpureus]
MHLRDTRFVSLDHVLDGLPSSGSTEYLRTSIANRREVYPFPDLCVCYSLETGSSIPSYLLRRVRMGFSRLFVTYCVETGSSFVRLFSTVRTGFESRSVLEYGTKGR